ncbi:MAG: hypothetical protein QOH04_823 [Sphingomonadales bacterium]|jgi:hypothetical protein|nr:hypothetical protein [Sphingomonadales bacterium]
MTAPTNEHSLEFLLAFDGRVHFLAGGYWTKFEIRRGEKTVQRPHGLSYSFTLHNASGKRIMGFDNAHAVPGPGSRFKKVPETHDHWHRSEDDKGRPYAFTSAEALIDDFEREVRRILADRGIDLTVLSVEEVNR